MSDPINIPYPLGGLNDVTAYGDQPFRTTRRAKNMRSIDCKTGRVRGAQRAGLTKHVGSPTGASFVQELQAITYDRRLTTYAVRDESPGIEWARVTPAETRVPDLAVTPGGDVVCLSGTDFVVKYNPEGTEVWRIKLPLASASERATCVALGLDGAVYVGTATTAEPFAGRVFRYDPSITDPNKMELFWTYDAVGRVPDIAINGFELAVLVNKSSVSELRLLIELATTVPAVKWVRPVPSPASQVVVDGDDQIFVCSLPNPTRGDVVNPDFCGVKTVDWQPLDQAEDVPGSLRCWLQGGEIPGLGDNQLVEIWLDSSGNGRNAYKAERSLGGADGPVQFPGTKGARFRSNAICGMPGVRFFNEAPDNEGRRLGLVSGIGNERWLPQGNTPYVACMVLASRSVDNGQPRGVVLQSPNKPFLSVGQDPDPRFAALSLEFPDAKDNVAGSPGESNDVNRTFANNQALAFANNEQNIMILCWALDPRDEGANGDREGSFFRVNGRIAGAGPGALNGWKLDQFTAKKLATDAKLFMGCTPFANNEVANVDICEFVVFDGDFLWPHDFEIPSGESSGTIPGAPYFGVWSSGYSASSSGGPGYTPGDSLIDKVEGYMAHKFGLQGLLPGTHPYKAAPPAGSSGSSSSGSGGGDTAKLLSKDGILAKFAASNGALRWAVTGAGIGFAVAVDGEGGVYSLGPVDVTSSTQESGAPDLDTTVRKIIDEGFDYSISPGDGAWSRTDAAPTLEGVRIAVDGEKNLYVPVHDAAGLVTIRKIDAAGLLEWNFAVPAVHRGVAVALDTIATDFGDDTIGEPEFIYLGTDRQDGEPSEETLYKLRLVDATVGVGAPRSTRVLAVNEGNVVRLVRNGDPSVVTVIGGAGALSDASRIVSSFSMNQRVFFVDGARYGQYDPRTDTFSEWKATSAGTLPRRARLSARWRGRAVLARAEGEAQNVYFSEVNNPYGWDLFPPVPTTTQAVSLAASFAGAVPDQVNALVPISDDILLLGCDHSIWMLLGDPAENGRLMLVTDTTGMAFGRPWCMDENGTIYFFGSRGGVFRMVPGGKPERISRAIDERLMAFDFNFFTVRMAWNDRSHGVHVLVTPIDIVDGEPSSSSGAGSSESSVEPSSESSMSSGSSSGPGSSGPGSSSSSSGAGSSGVSSSGPGSSSSSSSSSGPGPSSSSSSSSSGGSSSSSGPGPSSGPGSESGTSGSDVPEDPSPRGLAQSGMPQSHWFWERDTASWNEDCFALADFDPTAVVVIDGDEPDDRRVLIGSHDGYVREFDMNAADDDGEAIRASVLIGPIQPKSDHVEGRFSNFQLTLDSQANGCEMRLYAGDYAETLGDPIDTDCASPGRNAGWRRRVAGQSVWVELVNENAGERFAFESLAVEVEEAGRVRL